MNRYFYIDSEGKQKGPFSPEDLRNEHIRKETQVWTQGMPEWQRAFDVVELQPLFELQAAVSNNYVEPASPQRTTYQQTASEVLPAMPKSWMVESILVTLLPFLLCGNVFALLGIIAIVNASKVESLYHSGLYAQSKEASDNARRWTRITLWIAIGAVLLAIVGIIIFVSFFGSLAGIGNVFM